MPRSPKQLLVAVLSLALLAGLWAVAAPHALGGRTAYASIVGISMEPKLHRGDLAVIRQESSYRVGEVVAYRSVTLHRPVLHRIIGRQGDRYVFKGDNNNFVDVDKPTADMLIGRLWVKSPKLGAVVTSLRQPRNAALLAGLGALLLLGGGAGAGLRRRSGRELTLPAVGTPVLQALALGSGVLAAGCLVLVLVAFGRPVVRTAQAPGLYEERGAFSYRAATSPGPVYPDGQVRTGDAVFLALVRSVALRFDYRFSSPAQHAVSGTTSLTARLSGANGWKHTVLLQAEQPFHGDRASAAGTLPLARLAALVRKVETVTGTHSDGYGLTLAPTVKVHGLAGGQAVRTTFAPPLQLVLDPSSLRIDLTAGSAGGPPNTLERAETGVGTTAAPATIALGPLHVSVRRARIIGLAGGLAGLLVAVASAVLLAAGLLRRDEPPRIRARYGSLLVPVAAPRRGSTVEVASFESLLRLAEGYQRLILHEQRAGTDSYTVEEDGVLYRFDAQQHETEAGIETETTGSWTLEPEPVPGRERLRSVGS